MPTHFQAQRRIVFKWMTRQIGMWHRGMVMASGVLAWHPLPVSCPLTAGSRRMPPDALKIFPSIQFDFGFVWKN